MTMKIAYQGVAGAYSHIAARRLFPDQEYIACDTFEKAMSLVHEKQIDLAVIPVENSNAGRVADVHFLLPKSGLYIVGEYFLRIEHQLWGLPGSRLENIETAYSHPQALAQCSEFLKKNCIMPVARIDTAKSCSDIIRENDVKQAAIASQLAGEIYGLQKLASNIENTANNTTRFLIMSPQKEIPEYDGGKYITSFIFHAKNIPASLYKALGGFATNGINITKLESYLLDGKFVSAQFYVEIEAHPAQQAYKNAFEELTFFSQEVNILGTYQANPYRDL